MLLSSCAAPLNLPSPTYLAVTPGLKETEVAVPAAEFVSEMPLTLVSLPAAGRLDLEPANEVLLENLGLGGASPLNDPPYFPYNKNGLYWSERFPLAQGDILRITVYSYSPISWFGVDWSTLDVRGVLALTDTDEDGWSFNPLYPDYSSIDTNSDNTRLTLDYEIRENGDYQVVIKNTNTLKSWQLSLAVASN